MSLEVALYINKCQNCICRSQKQKPKSPLQPFNATAPGEILHLDIIENLPANKHRYKSILVFVDNFTAWSEAVPLTDTKAVTIARHLLDTWIARNSIPIQCHSDRGAQFTSEVFRIVSEMMNIKKTFTVSYRPMSNSHVESANKILKSLLKAFCQESPENWPEMIQLCLWAHRCSVHSNSKYSPFFLHRGFTPRTANDLIFGSFEGRKYRNQAEYAYELYHKMKKTHDFVADYLGASRDIMKRAYDKRANIIPYKEGQYAYLWRPRPANNKNKLFNCYYGPYLIKKTITPYVLKLDVGKSRVHPVVAHDRLKPAVGFDPKEDKVRHYDAIDLDLDHTLEIIPVDTDQRETSQNEPEVIERPVITQDLQEHRGMALRDRNAIARPDRYQAGFP